jgi:hypothetical protein
MDARAMDKLPDLVDHPEEVGRLAARQSNAFGRAELHVQRASDDEEKGADRNQQLEEQPGALEREHDHEHREPEKGKEQAGDERVAEHREQEDLAAICRGPCAGLRLQAANKSLPPLLIHKRSLPTGRLLSILVHSRAGGSGSEH